MWRSLRARLILASILWTTGLLLLIHMLSILAMHVAPALMRIHGVNAAMVGIAVMTAGVLALRGALRPFHSLRDKLGAVRTGTDPRLRGSYPAEVQPLIDDLNALLEDREQAVRRAMAAAGDLAHGLKTPLALLAQEAAEARAAGHTAFAENVAQQVERISRQANYHLARARAAASGSAGAPVCAIEPCIDALVRTMRKIHAARELVIVATVASSLSARLQKEDLEEMIGNVLDNACKWAKSRVDLSASQAGAQTVLTIDDDGPGLPPEMREMVLRRGVRLDESAPGSGLGLAIVRDLAELYGGSIALEDSPLGGLRASITLPE